MIVTHNSMRGAKMIVNSVNKSQNLAHKTSAEDFHISLHPTIIDLMISIPFYFFNIVYNTKTWPISI